MTQPTEPAARALQRVRKRHVAGTDGLCVDCGQTWPCATIYDTDGPPTDDKVGRAINRAITRLTAALEQPPATLVELRQWLRDAIDAEPPVPAPTPRGGTRGDVSGEPVVGEVDSHR